jgi:hypothetical protein
MVGAFPYRRVGSGERDVGGESRGRRVLRCTNGFHIIGKISAQDQFDPASADRCFQSLGIGATTKIQTETDAPGSRSMQFEAWIRGFFADREW